MSLLMETVQKVKDNSRPRDIVIFVDVDDTLIDHHDIPKEHVIRAIREAHAQGCRLYCWSQGDVDYVFRILEKIGLLNLFSGILPKPDICIDDLEIKSKFIKEWIHPIQLIGS